MKLFLLYFAVTAICFGAFGTESPRTSSFAIGASQSEDSSLLKPTDVAYSKAMVFARFLTRNGIAVKSVHLSKLNGFFQGLEKAAFFRTDKGVVEVIFFPTPAGAEGVRVTEQLKEGRYIYSFKGQPRPNSPGDTIDASRRMYFLTHADWFIMSDKEELYDAMKRALVEPCCQPGRV